MSSAADGPLQVLHVTESFGAGVAIAIGGIVAASPNVYHDLCFAKRQDVEDATLAQAGFRETVEMPQSTLARTRGLGQVIEALRPDIIHCHSSWAGFGVRIRRSRRPVVYSPHCFASEKADIGAVRRAIFRNAERLLVRRTEAVLANGEYEGQLARELGHQQVSSVSMFPADLSLVPSWKGESGLFRDGKPSRRPVVGVVGRWCPQKDPVYFEAVCHEMATLGRGDVDFMWIGGPDFGLKPQGDFPYLMTGWLERKQLLKEVGELDVLVHTAAWEAGVPLAVIEGLAASKPVIVRELRSAPELVRLSCRPPAEMAKVLSLLLGSEAEFRRYRNIGQEVFSSMIDRWQGFDYESFCRSVVRRGDRWGLR